ncbi:MRPL6 (YHR147C) [Zygosaccharomyces parabailii]|nr:MRPL6 (YHR147C) [Zygosaccharomyces parabailii]CDH09941.1 probable 54S ribosomal protein L6, mitochondrial [Zygosaccharomyces bailii ISA1307]
MSLISTRLFSVSRRVCSHIGSSPIYLAPDTKYSITTMTVSKVIRKGNKSLKLSQLVMVEGPKGKVGLEIPDFVKVHADENGAKINVSVLDASDKIQKSMWGTVRSLISNNITGVSEGHLATLKFVGTGYRAQLEQNGKFVSVKVGASVMQGLHVPDGITVKAPGPTSLIIEGSNKQQVHLFAANLRKFHPPEPYKGKGIYVNNETITLKDKKIK